MNEVIVNQVIEFAELTLIDNSKIHINFRLISAFKPNERNTDILIDGQWMTITTSIDKFTEFIHKNV